MYIVLRLRPSAQACIVVNTWLNLGALVKWHRVSYVTMEPRSCIRSFVEAPAIWRRVYLCIGSDIVYHATMEPRSCIHSFIKAPAFWRHVYLCVL